MKVTQEKLPASQIGLEIEITAETSQKTYEKVVQNLARSANIPGFRKGKVPRPILLQRLGTQRIKAAALEEMIQNSLEDALKQESIESLGNYKLRSNFEELVAQYQPGDPFTFSASVDVPPTVELGDYQAFDLKAEEIAYDPKEVEDWLEDRRSKQATLVPIEDRSAQMGDVAVIDYEGRLESAEGEESEEIISGVQGKDFQVELMEGKLIEGMVEGIVGMKPEETKEISVIFPSDYPREDLAGKPVIFSVVLKELKEKELPELDDDFAEEVSEFETIAELKESLETNFKEKAAEATKKNIQASIVAELVEICSVDLPESAIEKEVDLLLTQTAMQMQDMGLDIRQLFTSDNIAQMRQNARPEGIQRLKESLILKQIAKTESIAVEAAAVETRMQEVKEQLGDKEIDLERLRTMIEEELLREKTLDWLQEKATIELVPEGSLKKEEEAENLQTETLEVPAESSSEEE